MRHPSGAIVACSEPRIDCVREAPVWGGCKDGHKAARKRAADTKWRDPEEEAAEAIANLEGDVPLADEFVAFSGFHVDEVVGPPQ
jgi:hypothetical protein